MEHERQPLAGHFHCSQEPPLPPLPRPPLRERLRWRLAGLWRRLCGETPEFEECPACFYDFDWFEGVHFVPSACGVAFDGEVRSHWVEGMQHCPRCGGCWRVGDSS